MYAFDMKDKNTYKFDTIDEFEYLNKKMGYKIPVSRDVSPLSSKPIIKFGDNEIVLDNALSVHPMEGFDGTLEGAPTDLTEMRYLRFADSGAALLWSEAVSVCNEGRTSNHQLMMSEETVDSYTSLVSKIKTKTSAPIICQLTHSGRFSKNDYTPYPIIMESNEFIEKARPQDIGTPVATDEYLDTLPSLYAKAATLAVKAGFDGIDIKICHQYLLSEALSSFNRPGKYGGSYENRTRLIKNIFKAVRDVIPSNIFICSRFGISDMFPYPYGYGTMKDDPTTPDFSEAIKLLCELRDSYGLCLIDMTMGSPYVNPHINRPYNKGGYVPEENPLVGVERIINGAKAIKDNVKGITVIGTGYSYLKEASMYVAAGAIKEGYADIVGFGRMAFAYDTFAKDMINGKFDKNKSCITCSKCTELMRHGSVTGCPIRNQEIYLPIYRKNVMGK
ncbi:MAG: flavin oxidoreductase/NADH oxidase [Clostridia bacterium]|nr:flavin oxidoreductase/NADH oxidase [Clostridia bacterium]